MVTSSGGVSSFSAISLSWLSFGGSPGKVFSRSPSGPLGLALNAISPSYKGVSYELTSFVYFGSADFFSII